MRADGTVHDNDLDRAIRDLVEPMPRSRAWEQSQRNRLLTYIETGEISGGPERSAALARSAEIEPRGESPVMVSARRRLLALGGTTAAVILLVVGLVVTERPEAPPPAQAPAESETSPSVGVADVSDTVADPGTTDPGATDPATTDPAPPPTDFTPLVVGMPPAGYVLRTVEIAAGGVLTYGSDTSSTELWLVVRASTSEPHSFDNQMRDLDRPSWEVEGRTVWSDGELAGCLPDACSIGMQWDDHTVVRLMWVEPDAGTLAPGSDQDSLIALLTTLRVDPSVWANATEAPADVPDDAPALLLAPPVATVESGVTSSPIMDT